MKTTRIESSPYVFQLAQEQQPPAGWRVLFRGELRYELDGDERLPRKYGGTTSKRATEIEPDEEVAIASWVLGRLAYLFGVKEGDIANLIRRTSSGDELAIALDVQDGDRLVAQVQLVLGQEDVRLVGRMAKNDLDEPIANALKDVLLADPENVADIKVSIAAGINLGLDGGRPLGSQPRERDLGDIISRLQNEEQVERLADDREERCPLSRDFIVKEFLLSSRRPAWKPPKIKYLQSVAMGDDAAWVFSLSASRESCWAIVSHDREGRPKLEWWG